MPQKRMTRANSAHPIAVATYIPRHRKVCGGFLLELKTMLHEEFIYKRDLSEKPLVVIGTHQIGEELHVFVEGEEQELDALRNPPEEDEQAHSAA